MLDPTELEVFLAISETQSACGAARNLHVNPRIISQQAQKLERRLQVELFERRGGHMILTDAGKELLPLVRKFADLSIQIEETMAARHAGAAGGVSTHLPVLT